MTFQEVFEKLAKDAPAPQLVYWVESRPRCAECRDYEVMQSDDICEHCQKEHAQGYQVASLAGRCANGFEMDHGTRYHAIRPEEFKAVCGAQPGRRSVGWTREVDKEVTCPRCMKKLQVTHA